MVWGVQFFLSTVELTLMFSEFSNFNGDHRNKDLSDTPDQGGVLYLVISKFNPTSHFLPLLVAQNLFCTPLEKEI